MDPKDNRDVEGRGGVRLGVPIQAMEEEDASLTL